MEKKQENGVDTIGAGKIHLLFPKNKASSPYGYIKCVVDSSLFQTIRILTTLHLLRHNEQVWARFVGPQASALMPLLMDGLRSNNLVGPNQEP